MAAHVGMPHEIFDHLSEGVYCVDKDRTITFWNRGAERITGYTREEVEHTHCFDNLLVHVDEQGQSLCRGLCPTASTIKDGRPRDVEAYVHHRDGHRLPVSITTVPLRNGDGTISGAVEIFREHSSRQELEARVTQLQQLALADPLTGLANRRHLSMVMHAALDEHKRYGWPAGLLFLDADKFKSINDRFGHAVGDRVIKMVSATLMSNSRSFDTPGRWGGEEFVVLCRNLDRENLLAVAERFRALIASSFVDEEDEQVRVTVSVGATLAQPGDSVELLVLRADELMYQSKQQGGDCVSCG